MKKKLVCLKPFYGKIFLKNRIFNIDNGHNIFFDFDKKLKKEGVEIATIDIRSKRKVDRFIYCDIPYPWQIGLWIKVIFNRDKNILFCFESPLVNPFSHLKSFHFFFGKVYTWNDLLVGKGGGGKYFKFYVPQIDIGLNVKQKAFKDKNFLVMINTRKKAFDLFRLLSPFKKDLYKERIKAFEFFGKEIPKFFDLFGKGWELKKNHDPSFYKGKIERRGKIKKLAGYKYCLCFENAVADGYITEKIFDCFKSGCVPVYLGAPNVEKYFPEGSFIDCRKFESYKELLKYLKSIDSKEYDRYLLKGRRFLEDSKTKNIWFEERFEKIFLESLF